MKRISSAIALVLTISTLTYAQGNVFKKVRYQGGSVASTVKPDDWNNTLTVSSDKITLSLKDGKVQEIDPKKVTGLSYGQHAHRRVGTMIALAVLLTPLALFGMLSKSRKHFIGVEWTEDGDKKGGILLQGDKDDYRGILMALRGVTGAAVAVAESDRKFVPTGVEVITTRDVEDDKKKDEKDKKSKNF